ncbi:RagB/SusD family nutrient uptake outer membrane protein [Rufibacter soli]|jgi:starch-binding outer membrane protein, SusD/RagB family
MNMKKLLLLVLLGAALTSCDVDGDEFLGPQNTGAISEEMVFTDSIRTTAFLTRIYEDVGYGFNFGSFDSHGNLNQPTDDAEYSLSGSTQAAVILYAGTLNPSTYSSTTLFNNFWAMPYANIRRVNLLIANIGRSPLSPSTKNRMLGEARFLRAWYYHTLIKAYGGVPLIGDQVFTGTDIINVPRNSYEECVNYVVSELDAAAGMLDAVLQEQFYGRADKGACLGLKSRVLLFAASPLFNGGAVTNSPEVAKIVSYPTYSVARWQKAAQAAEEVINMGRYSLHVDNTTAPGYGFYDVFLKRVNNEYIFARHRPANRDVEGHFFPSTRGGAKYTMPTQNLVDAFPMANGKPITDPTSGYSETNPYVNRDPRFNNSIIYNGSEVYLASASRLQPVYTYLNAPTDGFGNGTTTGYYSRKMADVNSNANTERGWPLMRYAEILLNYAEAINETGQTTLAYPKLIDLRRRAGIQPGADNMYGLKANMTVDEMRTVIQNERRIELAFESHRFWDLRRWKTLEGMYTNGARQNQVMRIVKSGSATVVSPSDTYKYNRESSIRTHAFRPALYLFPIPQTEINKMPNMLQNPGY